MAEKVLNTRLSRGSWLAATISPRSDLRQRLRVAAAQILQHVGEAAAGAEADDRRRRQRHDGAALDLRGIAGRAAR